MAVAPGSPLLSSPLLSSPLLSSPLLSSGFLESSRNWQNYITDVEVLHAEATEPAAIESTHELFCKATSAKKVLDVVNKHGLGSPKVVDVYESQRHWLSRQSPAVDDPFSKYFMHAMHSTYCENIWPPQGFWKKLGDDIMATVVEHGSIESHQLELISGKILSITQDIFFLLITMHAGLNVSVLELSFCCSWRVLARIRWLSFSSSDDSGSVSS